MRFLLKTLSKLSFILLLSAPAHSQDLGGLIDGLGSAAGDLIGGDSLGDGGLFDIQILDGDILLPDNDGGTDLLLLGAPSEDSPLQYENVDLIVDDSISSDLESFNEEFSQDDVLRVNSTSGLSCIDSDGDSVCDGSDSCPDTPANSMVMPDGCAIGRGKSAGDNRYPIDQLAHARFDSGWVSWI